MVGINIQNNDKLSFIVEVLRVKNDNPYNIKVEGNSVFCENDLVNNMIQRFNKNQSCVLPFHYTKNSIPQIRYIILDTDKSNLLKTVNEVKSFLVPVYGEIENGLMLQFNPVASKIGELGYKLFKHGYSSIRSLDSQKNNVFYLLKLWISMNNLKPEMSEEDTEVSAYILRSNFYQALSLNNWDEANENIKKLKNGYYLTDENIIFLKIQLLSAQNKWEEIYNNNNFINISGLKYIPKKVKESLLKAYYICEIEKYESSNVELALQSFKKTYPKLGTLLRYRTGMNEEFILRLFAYYAVIENNINKLEDIKLDTKDDKTKEIIDSLKKYISNEGVEVENTENNIEKCIRLFKEEKFDEAYKISKKSEVCIEIVRILLGIAFMAREIELYKYAYDSYNKLTSEDKQKIQQSPDASAWLHIIELQLNSINMKDKFELSVTLEKEDILTWDAWFYYLNKDIYTDEEMLIALDNIISNSDNFEFNINDADKLNNLLLEITTSDLNRSKRKLFSNAINDFIAHIINNKNFPNILFIDIYETLIENVIEFSYINNNTILLLNTLIDGVLLLNVKKINNIWSNIKDWIKNIYPNIKTSLSMLELIFTFIDYGIPKSEFKFIWDNWIYCIIDNISEEYITEVNTWYKLGFDIDSNNYLVKELKNKIDDITIEKDPLSSASDISITIFSCRENSAKRAKDIITSRNDKIKVRICTDDKLTEQSKSYAKNSDLCIIVTSCISHALYYGVSPFIKNNVIYPLSSGETGIVKALEEYIMKIY